MSNELKIVFPDGNIVHTPNSQCLFPNPVSVNVVDLIPGKKYTVFMNNLNTTAVRLFPASYSFVADKTEKNLIFYYQFA